MKNLPFIFEKKDGKYISNLNPKWTVEMYTSYGIPIEMVLEEVERWTPLVVLNWKLLSWKVWAKENNIDPEPVKNVWRENENAIMPKLESLAKIL